jgi:glycosyltransferase involved in cell wall biosynthesis
MIIYLSDSINSKKHGGSSTSGFEFLQFLRVHYKDVVLVTSDKISIDAFGSEFYGVNLNQLAAVITIRRKVAILDRSLRSFVRPIYYFLKDLGKKNSIDLNKYYTEGGENILYVNSWSALFSSKILKNADRFTSVCIVRGSPESFIYQSFEEDKTEAVNNAAEFLERFDNLIYVSENGQKAWSKILMKKIESFYLPNSINEEEINRVKEVSPLDASLKLGFDQSAYNIVVVGSVQKRKAQDILLKVVKDFLVIKPNLQFHIVGIVSKTWGGDDIYNEIINSEFADRFTFHGHSDEVVLYMQAADLLIFTSHAEAFPRTVAEYMAIGKPILAADVSGVSEMIKHGENGYLYNSHEPKSLIEVFRKLEDNQEEKQRLAKNASISYWNNFSKSIHMLRAIAVFKEIDHG